MEIQAGDVELYAVVKGPEEGPTVVFIHGFPVDHRMWEHQLRALPDGYRAVAYDIRGLGRSPVGDGQYTMELFTDDLFAVLDAVASDPVVACGLSMGGYVLGRALERNPGRFRAAVLADTRSTADDDETRLARAAAIAGVKQDGPTAYAEEFVERVLAGATLSRRPEIVEAVKQMIASNDPRGIAGAQLAMMSRTDTTAALAGLEIPVLVVVGEEDDLTPPKTAREMAAPIPDGRLAVVPDAGHFSPLENPDAFNRILRDFLDGLE